MFAHSYCQRALPSISKKISGFYPIRCPAENVCNHLRACFSINEATARLRELVWRLSKVSPGDGGNINIRLNLLFNHTVEHMNVKNSDPKVDCSTLSRLDKSKSRFNRCFELKIRIPTSSTRTSPRTNFRIITYSSRAKL